MNTIHTTILEWGKPSNPVSFSQSLKMLSKHKERGWRLPSEDELTQAIRTGHPGVSYGKYWVNDPNVVVHYDDACSSLAPVSRGLRAKIILVRVEQANCMVLR